MKYRFPALLVVLALVLGLMGCGNAEQTYTDYVQAVMDCSYHHDFDAYLAMTECTADEAQEVFREEQAYLSELLRYHAAVNEDYLTEETRTAYDTLAAQIMSKTRYTVTPGLRDGNAYQVNVRAEPIDLFERALPELEAAYKKDFTARFYKLNKFCPDGRGIAALERKWSERALAIYRSNVMELSYLEPVTETVGLYAKAGRYSLPENSWHTLDELLYGQGDAS